MTTSNSSTVASPLKQTGFIGCILTILTIIFVILGIYNLVLSSIFAYLFSSARMISPATIAIAVIVAIDCFIYFFLAFRIKRQHWLISLALLALVLIVFPFALRSQINTATMRIRNDGYSMGSTLPNGSYVLANRQAYQQDDPQRGDIVVFQLPSSPDSVLLVKRIIGLPGEVVSISDGQVLINGTPISESYISEKPAYNGEWKVSEGHYFVLGDNRNDSKDSHQWGTLPRENILAKAVWIYFPLSDFGKIIDFSYAP